MDEFKNNHLTINSLQKEPALRFFQLGLFFLPSAPAISLLLILPALIVSILKRKESYIKDRWNFPFIITAFLMITSYSVALYNQNNDNFLSSNGTALPLSSWLDLVNWLPFFVCFWLVQPYLKSKENRRICALSFLCGSIPVIVTGFGQYWFNWYGPFDLFNGLIIWFQRPIHNGGGLSGLFNNANYAGALLIMILPFSLASFKRNNFSLVKNIITIFINISLITAIILTNSRNAWICLFLALIMMFGSRKLVFFLFSLISTIFISTNFITPLRVLLEKVVPSKIILNFDYNHIISDARVNIWENTIWFISQKPLFGYGGSNYESIQSINGICIPPSCEQHTHNLTLELALKYGLPAAIILSSTILVLLYLGYKHVYNNISSNINISKSDIYEKAWVTSLFLIFISHLLDMQYFDIRISFFSWILLAGVKNMIYKENTRSIFINHKTNYSHLD